MNNDTFSKGSPKFSKCTFAILGGSWVGLGSILGGSWWILDNLGLILVDLGGSWVDLGWIFGGCRVDLGWIFGGS